MNNYFWLVLSLVWFGLIVYLFFFNPLIEDNAEPLFSGVRVSLIFGFVIELVQHFFTYNRYGSISDILANAPGILLIVVMIYYLKLFRFNPKI